MHFMQPGSTTIPYAAPPRAPARSRCSRRCSGRTACRRRSRGSGRARRGRRRRRSRRRDRRRCRSPSARGSRRSRSRRRRGTGTATATGGKVAQKSVVIRWLVNCGISGSFGGFAKNATARRPDEHVERDEQRDEDEQPRAERPRADAQLLHQPGAEVLQGHDVAAPAAEEAAEDERGAGSPA